MNTRSNRIAEQIRREISQALLLNLNDPHLRGITLTSVEVTKDFAHAKIYYSHAAETPLLQTSLEKAKGVLRGHLSKKLMLRVVPDLHFIFDKTAITAEKIEILLRQVL